MNFAHPQLLLLLLLLPLLVWGIRATARRGRASAHALLPGLSQLARMPGVPRQGPGAGLYLTALALALVAAAGPQAAVRLPDRRAEVVLAMDISGSMRAADISPDRLTAAKRAAQSFVRSLPEGVKVGLVSFSDTATLVVPPTADRQQVLDHIELLELAHATAIGDGLSESLKTFPVDRRGKPLGPSTVVLLSDGRSNRGMDPLEAAKKARGMGVPVHTIGLGKPLRAGEVLDYLAFDEQALRAVAGLTGGRYYTADSAAALPAAYRKLNRVVGWKLSRTEVSGLFGLLAGLALASSLLLSALRRKVL